MSESEPPANGRPFAWGDFFAFRIMVTPILIRIVYAVGVVVISLGSILLPILGMTAQGGPIPLVIVGALTFIVGNLYWRVLMELLMVLFGIHGSVRAIEDRERR